MRLSQKQINEKIQQLKSDLANPKLILTNEERSGRREEILKAQKSLPMFEARNFESLCAEINAIESDILDENQDNRDALNQKLHVLIERARTTIEDFTEASIPDYNFLLSILRKKINLYKNDIRNVFEKSTCEIYFNYFNSHLYTPSIDSGVFPRETIEKMTDGSIKC
jgi:hypothetical protein